MADEMTQPQQAAALWGWAENKAVPLDDRLRAALAALNYYGRDIDVDDITKARKLLEFEGFTVKDPPPPPPVHHCAVCGKTDEDNYDDGFGPLVDFRLVVSDGEEGFSDVTRYFCQEHMVKVADALVELGLGSHHHGSTTFVEADTEECGGYGECKRYEEFDDMREVY